MRTPNPMIARGIRDLGRSLMDIFVEWQPQGCGRGTVLYCTGIRHLFMCHGVVGISKKLDTRFPICFVPAWQQHPLHELSNHHQITGHTSSACMLQHFGAAHKHQNNESSSQWRACNQWLPSRPTLSTPPSRTRRPSRRRPSS